MTSGNFISMILSEIQIDRAARQRKKLPNIPDLADSIRRLGLIHPIVIDRENNLIAGERRIEACRSLGWTHITCQYVDELDVLIARAIELEENVKREILPWQDECKAVAEYHSIRKQEEPTWSYEDTGKALGIGETYVKQKLQVAREIAGGNKMVIEAPLFSTARGIVQRAESRKDDEALAAITKRPSLPGSLETPSDSILTADFNEWAETYAGPRFNFLHCDFPYGIDANKFNQGAASAHGGYSDTEEEYWILCHTLARNLNRLCTESAHIMFWFSMHYYHDTLLFFETYTDFRIDPFPLIWMKSDNVGILPDPERGPRRIYETCFFGSRGDRKVVRSTSNAVFSPSQRDDHMSIKPAEMLTRFFTMFVDTNTVMLDPTCGSGGALKAAEAMGASHIIGLERNEEFAERANVALRKARNARTQSLVVSGAV